MPFYQTPKELYMAAEALFYRLQEEDPKAAEAVTASRLVIKLLVSNPDGVIVINGRNRPATTHFGANSLTPNLEITLEADILHQILLGKLKLRHAIAEKKLKVKGPTLKVMMLAPLFQHSQKVYPQILREQNLL